MSETYSIGSLAKSAGVLTSTVRYYERRGLLKPESRSAGNYRQYGEASVQRLKFVRSAQSAGFTLADIAFLLRFREGDPAPCKKIQELTEARLGQVDEQIQQLRAVDVMLRGWLKACRRKGRPGRCVLLDGLTERSQDCCEPPKIAGKRS